MTLLTGEILLLSLCATIGIASAGLADESWQKVEKRGELIVGFCAQYPLPLRALETVMTGARLRWLTGVERHVTTKVNVYGEKIDQAEYEQMIGRAIADEYEKALILASLEEGPLSVREIACRKGLPVYTVSLRLNDLERRGAAEFRSFDGTTAKFVSAV